MHFWLYQHVRNWNSWPLAESNDVNWFFPTIKKNMKLKEWTRIWNLKEAIFTWITSSVAKCNREDILMPMMANSWEINSRNSKMTNVNAISWMALIKESFLSCPFKIRIFSIHSHYEKYFLFIQVFFLFHMPRNQDCSV